eukprot:605585_1
MGSTVSNVCTCGTTQTYDLKSITSRAPHHAQNTNIQIRTTNVIVESPPHDHSHITNAYALDEKTLQLLINMDVGEMPGHHVDSLDADVPSSQLPALSVHDGSSMQDLDPDEQDMIANSNPRLVRMSTLTNVNELQKAIDRNYNVISSPTSDADDTEENMTNISTTPPLKPYQFDGDTLWNENDLNDLSYEMTQEMHRLMNQGMSTELHIQTKHLNGITQFTPTISTNLVQDKTWTTPRIEDEREAMKKQMLHLATESYTWQ